MLRVGVARILCALLVCLLGARIAVAGVRPVHVALDTALGTIVIAIDVEHAPMAGGYFLDYVDRGQYAGAEFYRSGSLDGSTAPQLVQGGIMREALTRTDTIDPADYGAAYLPAFEATGQSGLRHVRGTVSLARDLLRSGLVIPEFVICLRDAPGLDEGGSRKPDARGYPAIGHVVEGMAIMDALAGAARGGATTIGFLQGQILSTPVRIERARRVDEPSPRIPSSKQARNTR